jgi:uncharacterized membrane protein
MFSNEELEKMGILFFIGWYLVIIGMLPIWKCINYYTWGYHYTTESISVSEAIMYVFIGILLVIIGVILMGIEYVKVKKRELNKNEKS